MDELIKDSQNIPNEGIFIIFGITGDLSQQYLMPALYHLEEKNLLSENFKIVGTTRKNTTPDDVITEIKQSLERNDETINENTASRLKAKLSMVNMNIT